MKRQGQIIAATLTNFEAAERAMKSMEESFGSADRELSVVQETVNYSLANLKSVLVGIAQSNITQDFLKDIINDATRFLEVFKNSEATIRPFLTVFEKLVSLVVSLTEAFGGLGTIIGGIALKNAVSGTGRDKMFSLIEYARCNVVVTLNELCV